MKIRYCVRGQIERKDRELMTFNMDIALFHQSIALITGSGDTVMANVFAGRGPISNVHNGRHAKE